MIDVARVELAYKKLHAAILETYSGQPVPASITTAMHELYIAITGDLQEEDDEDL